MKVACRARGGSRIEFEVLDISSAGCMIACRNWSAKVGESIFAKFEGLEALPSEVVWAADGKAGLAFEQMLHETVLARLTVSLDSSSAS